LESTPGWRDLSARFDETLNLLKQTDVVKTVHRFGLHYINYFDHNILRNLTLAFSVDGESLFGESTLFKTVIPCDGYKLQLQVLTEVKVTPQIPSLKIKQGETGSLIDIDCYQDYPGAEGDLLKAIGTFIESAHAGEKQVFFSLLNDDFLKTFNPQY
jgi:uncharacterized protein (TIGR04255 family)